MKQISVTIVVLLVLTCSTVQASQFRESRSIAAKGSRVTIEDGWQSSSEQLNPRMVEHAVNLIAENYRSAKLSDLLSDRFVNRSVLLDDIRANVPLDAVLRIISMDFPRVLSQSQRRDSQGNLELRSQVVVNVRSQLEFSDPDLGFQIRDDVSEWVITLHSKRMLVRTTEEGLQ